MLTGELFRTINIYMPFPTRPRCRSIINLQYDEGYCSPLRNLFLEKTINPKLVPNVPKHLQLIFIAVLAGICVNINMVTI